MNKLILNKDIYTSKAIDMARIAFGHLSEIIYESNEKYHILTFEKCEYDTHITMNEFENYAVNLMVNKNVK